ncbi:MAG: triose-phosphate isomerase [Clostridiales Family XIII bacterium]|jgi:triosephosphate isomerase|nr:triose-phosphate isomerase [Clostridiales Family XIII bacterium]
MRKKLIAGNWKMYKTAAEAVAFAEEFSAVVNAAKPEPDIAICAPFTDLAALIPAFGGSAVSVGAQNVHFEKEGAFTGEISPGMLAEAGVDYCIVGHSERRQYFAETDEGVNLKAKALFEVGIIPIVCVGEVLAEREAGREKDVVGKQLRDGLAGIAGQDFEKLVIAYEPVWAIGTGRTATSGQAEEMCAYIRSVVKEMAGQDVADRVRIQYGGSVNAENAAEILGQPDIDGALVGGASLSPDKFITICKA